MKTTALATPGPGLVTFEAAACRDEPGAWVVRGVNYGRTGEVYLARFSGSAAQERAEEYARWKNGVIARGTSHVGEHRRTHAGRDSTST